MYLKPSCCHRIPLWPWNWISEDKVGISRSNPDSLSGWRWPVPESRIPGKLMIASTRSSCTLSTQLQELLIRSDLLHAGPSLFLASLFRHFHLVRGHSLIRLIMCSAITSAARCQRNHLISARLKALHGTSSPNVLLTLANYVGGDRQKVWRNTFL